jgi:hypothetical protein
MRRLVLAAIVGALAWGVTAASPAATDADLVWCFSDPVLVVDGRAIHIDLGVPKEHRDDIVTSSLVVTVPSNVRAHLAGERAANFPIAVERMIGPPQVGDTITITVVGLISGPALMPTVLRVRQSAAGELALVPGRAGAPMQATFAVR